MIVATFHAVKRFIPVVKTKIKQAVAIQTVCIVKGFIYCKWNDVSVQVTST